MIAGVDAKPDYSTYPRLSQEDACAAAESLLSMKGEGNAVARDDLAAIVAFYHREARLLDEERYHEWYQLLADDLFYWMPLRENRYRRDKRRPISPENMAFFDECKADIAVRIGRIASSLAWTEDPPTFHLYSIANVEAFATDRQGEFEVHSTFHQYRNRAEHDEASLFGRRRDLLRQVGKDFQIVRRMILLPQSVLLTKNLSVFF